MRKSRGSLLLVVVFCGQPVAAMIMGVAAVMAIGLLVVAPGWTAASQHG